MVSGLRRISRPKVNGILPITVPMETPLAIDDAEMQRILFSTNPPLGELPAFESIEVIPPSRDIEIQLLDCSNPGIRAVDALYMAGDTDRVNGADRNAICQMDITPLSTAVAEAPYSVVEQLLTHCPATTVFRGQLLHHAADRHIPEDYDVILRLVLQRCQKDINALTYQDHRFSYEVRKIVGLGTALHEAARVGQLSGIRALIAHGADISIRDSCGNTALEVAERKHSLSVVEATTV
nr:hypothetical protein CFP56_75515 [Quercus suber]